MSGTSMRAAVTDGHGGLEMVDLPRPEPGSADLLIRVDRAGICGSDLHALTMVRAGSVLGHEFVGTVVGMGDEATGFEIGDRVCSVPAIGCGRCVACLTGDPVHCQSVRPIGGRKNGGFAEYLTCGAQWSVRVPDSVSSDVAALVEPLAVGLKIVSSASVRPTEHVVVLGAGPIGLAVILWMRVQGMDAALVSDPVESRRKLAVGLGAAAAVDPLTEDLKQRAVDHFGSLPEVVIEVAGRAGLLAVATDLVAAHGRILLAGLHGEPESFHRLTPLVKEVSILFPNFTTKPGFVHTMARLEDGSLAPEALITHHVTLAELPGIVAALRVPNDFGKVLIAMD